MNFQTGSQHMGDKDAIFSLETPGGNLLSLLSQRNLPECGPQEAENCYTTPTRREEEIQEEMCTCAH